MLIINSLPTEHMHRLVLCLKDGVAKNQTVSRSWPYSLIGTQPHLMSRVRPFLDHSVNMLESHDRSLRKMLTDKWQY
jgi:hypothetical protein